MFRQGHEWIRVANVTTPYYWNPSPNVVSEIQAVKKLIVILQRFLIDEICNTLLS